ncbi:Phosphodiest-domain-containing protein [Fomitiporia mediterranea MF3/22]|uniref:Phosphodiest-domain-containing protein n=1 Tax=Fomitiporia mediterranea (strain MF3/22) TaxID=694068 RepID=UPI0004409AA2|nr:Phosphodiest-domain-containing protein [Fomitiporia mediterranea MF3/22]EJC97836.1 Phosphodiest-domain-containing protein [Fomitiporia mediterranea MF3/22]
MAHPSNSLPMFSKDPPPPSENEGNELEDHELQGLLSGVQSSNRQDAKKERGLFDWLDDRKPWTRKRMALIAGGLVLLLLGAALAPPCLNLGRGNRKSMHPNQKFVGSELRSNGTHDFKRTVLIVSIDGLRADYLDRGLTPHLLDISKKGLRAKYMKPIFPTLTFPNHWALMTGLYAESHGIVANNFWDPQSKSEFHYNKETTTWNPSWWFGEPMWETTGRAGLISANLMWPGPPKTMTGASPTYFKPWRDKVPLDEKLDQIMEWIDMPLEDRPQLIMAYEPTLDQAGHLKGPNSKLVNDTLKYVDTFAKDLHLELVARNLTDIVDIIFVSDHGMTDTSHPELVYLDDILGEEGYAYIEHEDGWPSKGLWFSNKCNVTHYLDVLLSAAAENPEKFAVYTRETMPERYHFANSDRIAPVYVVPKIGYALTTRAEGDDGVSKGSHGYDNNEPSMRAMFVAHGPFSTNVKDVNSKRSVSWSSSLFSRAAKMNAPTGWHSIDKSAYVMEGFENVQIYGLVMKLLGLEDWSARNNATKGFWDKYF